MAFSFRLHCTTAIVFGAISLGAAKEAAGQTADMVDVVGRLGITFLEEASRREDATTGVPDPLAHHRAAQAAMDRYDELRSAYASAQSGGRNFAAIADGIIGGSVAVVNVPGVVGGVILRGAIGYANAELDRQSRQVSIEYLGAVSEEILRATGETDLTALALTDQAALQRELERSRDLLQGVRARAAEQGEPELIATTAATIAQAAHDAARDGLVLGATIGADIQEIDARLTGYMTETRTSLAETAQLIEANSVRIGTLEADVSELRGSVVTMEAEVTRLGANQDLVVDFMFSRMTLGERADALETGLLDRRISCPAGEADCDVATIRNALIQRYRTHATIESALRDTAIVLTIAGDIGIDVPPEIAEGLNIANAAFTAFTTWSTNPLGAIQAITGLFGSKRDAEAERHAALMNFLAENFQRINEQLVQVQRNQQKIMDSLVAVSEQIADMHHNLDSRLSALQADILVIGDNVRALLWEDFRSCATTFQQARNPVGFNRPGYIDLGTLEFHSFEHRVALANTHSRQVTTCMDAILETATAFRNPRGWSTFGSFIDLNRSVLQVSQEQAEGLQQAGTRDGVADYRSQAHRYVDELVNPSARILTAWAARNGVDELTLLHVLAEQPMDMMALEEVRARLGLAGTAADEAWRFSCDRSHRTYRLIAEITCEGEDPRGMAAIYLRAPIASEPIHDLAREVVVVGQLADLHLGEGTRFATYLADVAQIRGAPRGREMAEIMLAMATIAVAHEQRLYGGLTALAIAEDIIEGRPLGEDHYRVLSANPYLAQNVMTILMHRWVGATEIEDAFEGVSFVNRYTNAIVYSRSEAPHPLDQLHAIFSEVQDRPWGRDASNGHAVYIVSTDVGTVQLQLPGPMQVAEGRFVFPPSYPRLVAARELLIDRIIGYELGQEEFVPALLVGLTLP